MPTNQEAFDIVVAGARKQGSKSLSHPSYGCAYRGRNGAKCFAGMLIPDSRYCADFEGDGSLNPERDELEWNGPTRAISAEGYDVLFVAQLQDIHDDYDPDKWEEGFAALAADYNLTYTPPQPAEETP